LRNNILLRHCGQDLQSLIRLQNIV
jgi:hypothetical protein